MVTKKLTKRNYFIISKNYQQSLIYVDYIDRKKDTIKITYLNWYGRYWKNRSSESLSSFMEGIQWVKKIHLKTETNSYILEAIKDKKTREKQSFPKKGTKRWYQLFKE